LKTLFPDVVYPVSDSPTVQKKEENTTSQLIDKPEVLKPIQEPNIQPDVSSETIQTESPAKNLKQKHNEIHLDITARHIFIKMPKNDVDIAFVRSFKYVLWDTKNYRWVVPNYGKMRRKYVRTSTEKSLNN
jgi:hypothetical protein